MKEKQKRKVRYLRGTLTQLMMLIEILLSIAILSVLGIIQVWSLCWIILSCIIEVLILFLCLYWWSCRVKKEVLSQHLKSVIERYNISKKDLKN